MSCPAKGHANKLQLLLDLPCSPDVGCRGSAKDTRGTAYIVYEDIYDAKTAVDHLSGFNVANRYLIVL